MTQQIKKHRHLRLLGQINGNHLHKTPREYIASFGESFDVEMDDDLKNNLNSAAKLALQGNMLELYGLLDSRHREKMLRYLRSV
jgi:hypothetical protein